MFHRIQVTMVKRRGSATAERRGCSQSCNQEQTHGKQQQGARAHRADRMARTHVATQGTCHLKKGARAAAQLVDHTRSSLPEHVWEERGFRRCLILELKFSPCHIEYS
ncbi:hypothetical protein SETIT_8G226400v2 [Setaria italica]|uniref:Uncharacterized protein n=1 Tax=Setaria italica TaxID=4555 RepID=A0A368SAH7_SETIT|nr:hypothetical protein SETIT_8G226400v2 [Setaria italica]